MRPLKALSFLFGFAIVVGCQGPDEFYRLSNETGTAGASSPGTGGSAMGTAGNSATGTAGTTSGRGGSTGSAGSIISGTGGAGGAGAGGTGGSIAGTAGVTGGGGGAGSGSGGTTSSRGGTTGYGGAGAGGSTGRGGTTGSAGTGGTAGGGTGTAGSGGAGGSTTSRGGTTGSGGGAGSTTSRGGTTGNGGASGGTTGSGGAGGRGPDRIQVVAQCQSTTSAPQDIRVTFKILNPESAAKQWSDVKVRYYFTLTTQLPASVVIDYAQKIPKSEITSTVTDSYVEVGFTTAAGMIAGFDNVTGSDEIQLHLYNYGSPTWNTSQTDDYSYKSCASGASTSAYTDRLTMPGYYQGQLAWGSEP